MALGVLLAGMAFHRGWAATEPQTNSPPQEPTREFVVTGKVADADGKPMEGVEVTAQCGIGTLLPTGKTETDTHGNYRLAFGPGVLMGKSLRRGAPGVGFQVATVSARKPGFAIRGLGKQGNLAMGDADAEPPKWATNFSGIVRPREPYRVDFVLEPAARIAGDVQMWSGAPEKLDLCLTGSALPPSSSVLGCQSIGANGRFEFRDVPVGHAWWFETSWRKGDGRKTVRSSPWTPTNATPHRIHLKITPTAIELAE